MALLNTLTKKIRRKRGFLGKTATPPVTSITWVGATACGNAPEQLAYSVEDTLAVGVKLYANPELSELYSTNSTVFVYLGIWYEVDSVTSEIVNFGECYDSVLYSSSCGVEADSTAFVQPEANPIGVGITAYYSDAFGDEYFPSGIIYIDYNNDGFTDYILEIGGNGVLLSATPCGT